ncbi:hypothetical protein RKLH11_2905 [Rhodobacteraceae bacterium KLH11]|nr:hypothetical protein RKLH11_2905 [Rhodobacteraceae bacterium KLH11]
MRKYDLKALLNRIYRENRSSRHLRRFAVSTDGSMTILTLFLIMIVFTVAGFAVDLMRYDRERVRLQYALDRAVLAAADLDQELCPRVVVNDYISKEGFDPGIIDEIKVDPETCLNTDSSDSDGDGTDSSDASGSDSDPSDTASSGTESGSDGTSSGGDTAGTSTTTNAVELQGKRKVEASAQLNIETHFMKWSGVDTINSTAVSAAEESIGNVEISLVLDVSGSMEGAKLTNLQKAAKDFVKEMLEKSADDSLSISIIPYSEQVGVPDYMMDKINTTGGNKVANCIEFQPADFTAIPFTAFSIGAPSEATNPPPSVPQSLHFTNRSNDFRRGGNRDHRSTNDVVSRFSPWDANFPCREDTPTDRREMVVIQNDLDTLNKQINNLVAAGSTSINIGLKWGLALLDESIQPLIKTVANDTNVPKIFEDRPRPTNTTDTLKVVVLMTDGKNDLQRAVVPPYNDGPSDVFWNAGAQEYSVLVDEDNSQFLWPDVSINEWTNKDTSNQKYWEREEYQNHAYGAGTTRYRRCKTFYTSTGRCASFYDEVRDATELGTQPVRLEWPDVWAHTEIKAIESLFRRTKGDTYADDFIRNSIVTADISKKNEQVVSLCGKAEEKEVLIFSIAFEAPSSVKQMLKDCAVKPARYYEATGTQIERVFDSISTSIQNLRLTQ